MQRALLTLKLGDRAEAVFDALDDALEKLKESGWGPEIQARRIDGNKWAYAFHDEYEVTFRVSGVKPADGPTEEMWLELLTIPVVNR